MGEFVIFVVSKVLLRNDGKIGDVVKGLAYLHTESIVHGDLRGVRVLFSMTLNVCPAEPSHSQMSWWMTT